MPNLIAPNSMSKVVDDDGLMTDEFNRWVFRVTMNDPTVGQGSPEGALSATIGSVYIDTDSTTVALYIKQKPDIGGDTSKGWFGLSGAPA